jgi:hypothetical protein
MSRISNDSWIFALFSHKYPPLRFRARHHGEVTLAQPRDLVMGDLKIWRLGDRPNLATSHARDVDDPPM